MCCNDVVVGALMSKFLHSWLRPLTPAARDARIGTIAANRHSRCLVHPRPRALQPARALVCARRVSAHARTTRRVRGVLEILAREPPDDMTRTNSPKCS